MEAIVSLAKRRGFVFPSSEIYGGMGGFWDYGPLGVELRNNIKAAWWRAMVQQRDDIVGLDAAIVMNPRVWEVSGHVGGFSDPMVDCRNCKLRFRAEDLKGPPSEIACPNCGQRGTLTEARQFNLMFKTHVGPLEESASVAYLRPETAQGIFVNFDNVATTTRKKLPFGIAQIGKSFRNEITPGNFIFRDRELEQMEMEFFVHPSEEERWFAYWVDERLRWWTDALGISAARLRLRPHDPDELSHYSRQTTDIEYDFPMGWSELEGIADRTDYDLRAHAAGSGKALAIFDEASGEHVVPYVIEPAMGVDRAALTVLLDGYEEEQLVREKRVVLRIRPSLAPIKAAVLPLLRNRPELVERARALTADLKRRMAATYDDTASIGKLYRRQDEIGTPYCVTVDVDSLEDGAATIRERDTMTQERVALSDIPTRLFSLLDGSATWAGVRREPAVAAEADGGAG
ncbi:MAG TPA: glycine--tRNA ligase [Candidatus Limnocylindria bacterium]|jgi:glycyl-tRNA synthetase|nr:glycine--tRNA ligase [Candidatus Limnocylindria bacterium]